MPFYKGWPGGPGIPVIYKDFYEALDKLALYHHLEWPAPTKLEVERLQQRIHFWERKRNYTKHLRTKWAVDRLLIWRTV